MRKLIYSIGVTLFLAFLAFHVTTSLTNPFYGVSVEALAQGSGSGGSENNCNKCVVKQGETVLFSCETKENETCQKTFVVDDKTVLVRCTNAKKCKNE